MKLKLYFDHDKIVGQGQIIAPAGYFPKEVFSGIVVVRMYDNEYYEMSLNHYIGQEVLKIHSEGRPGARSKIYKLLGTREPVAYDMLMSRLLKNELVNEPVNELVNYYFLWKEINARGVYIQTAVDKNIILDKAIYEGILEYDNSGYYSIAYSFIETIKQKKSYKPEKAMEIIQCPDKELTISVFENFGYKWKNGKLVLSKDKDTGLFDQ